MNIKDIEPTKGNVLVELFTPPKKVGDLYIPSSDQDNNAPVRGKIIRTPKDYPSNFKVGETIFFRKYAIDELKFKKEDLTEEVVFIIEESEVLGVIRPLEEKKSDNTAEIRKETKKADTDQRDLIKKK